MKYLKLSLLTIISVATILYFRSMGSTKAEYNSNFQWIEGKVNGPFVIISENFHLVTNDSLRGGEMAYMDLKATLREHELYDDYSAFSEAVKTHDMSWSTKPIDTLRTINANAWNTIKEKEEKIVYSKDTSFHTDLIFPIDIPIKLSVERTVTASVYFSLGKNPDLFQINFPKDYDFGDDKFELDEVAKKYVGLTTNSTFENLHLKHSKLKAFLQDHEKLAVKRLKNSQKNALAYAVKNENEKVIFEDEVGLENLSYWNEDLQLWYDSWLVKIIIGIELLTLLAIISSLFARRNKVNKK